MVKVPKSVVWKDIIISESQWFNVDETQVYKSLNYVFENINEVISKGKKLMKINREKFTLKKMTEKLDKIMEKNTKDIPMQVGLNLPKLKKVGENKTESPTINLPKLKKITKEEVSV